MIIETHPTLPRIGTDLNEHPTLPRIGIDLVEHPPLPRIGTDLVEHPTLPRFGTDDLVSHNVLFAYSIELCDEFNLRYFA